jgi:hypothetical protein
MANVATETVYSALSGAAQYYHSRAHLGVDPPVSQSWSACARRCDRRNCHRTSLLHFIVFLSENHSIFTAVLKSRATKFCDQFLMYVDGISDADEP